MNVSEETRQLILKQERSKNAKKAATTLLRKFGLDHFKNLGSKGGSKPKKKRQSTVTVLERLTA